MGHVRVSGRALSEAVPRAGLDPPPAFSALVPGVTACPIERVHAWSATPEGMVLSCVAGRVWCATVRLTPWAPNIIRYRLTAGPHAGAPAPAYPIRDPDPNVGHEIRETAAGWRLETDALVLEIGRTPWTLAYRTGEGRPLTRQVADDVNLGGDVLGPAPGFELDGASQDPARQARRGFETLLLDPHDHWYGFGEKFTDLDKRGQTIDVWQENAAGARTGAAYKNIPLMMTPRGYGVFVNSTARVTCWMGSRSTRTWSLAVPGDTVEYFFIAGTLAEILESYARLTGFPPVPPRWSFGLWASTSFVPIDQAQVGARARRLRREGIPADVVHLDATWQRAEERSDLRWDPEAFPDPARLISDLHGLGYKVSLWENPYVSIHSSLFQEGAARGYFLRRPDGSVYTPQIGSGAGGRRYPLCAIVDFTNPAAAEWFRALHAPLLEAGVDTFKTDFGEEIPVDAVFHNGRTGAEMRNMYARLYQELVFTMLRERHGVAVIWARAACPGAQQFPVHWSGDPHCTYEDMAATLRGGLSAGMSGVAFWSHDIGGFYGTPTPDLYVRWAQFGLLSGHARYHGTTVRDPWAFGDDILAIFRRYAVLRSRLVPYLYTYACCAAETGLPLMRPLVLRYQDDPATYGIDLQYLLGDELLIAPVFDPDGRVAAYLPRGRWTDFWTGEVIQGPCAIRRLAPRDVLPVYVRENSLVPLGPPLQYAGERPCDPLTVEAYVTAEARFTLRGEDEQLPLTVRREGPAFDFEAGAAAATYTVRFHGAGDAAAATADGRPLARVADPAELDRISEGWVVASGVVTVKARARRIRLAGCPEFPAAPS